MSTLGSDPNGWWGIGIAAIALAGGGIRFLVGLRNDRPLLLVQVSFVPHHWVEYFCGVTNSPDMMNDGPALRVQISNEGGGKLRVDEVELVVVDPAGKMRRIGLELPAEHEKRILGRSEPLVIFLNASDSRVREIPASYSRVFVEAKWNGRGSKEIQGPEIARAFDALQEVLQR